MSDTHAPCPECGIIVNVAETFDAEECPECNTDLNDLIIKANES
jgi:uncharacterized paraquat-inducible protein A